MKNHNPANWSQLLEDLLEIIAGKLTCFLDNVRFGAVCRSWQSTMVNMHHRQPCWDPWLLLRERQDDSMIRDVYSLSKDNVFELKLPEAHAKCCVGSSKGCWLVLVDESLSVHLLNPCTRVQYQLPHAHDQFAEHSTSKDRFILKVVLSSSPSSSDCIAMVIFTLSRKLAFVRPGDEAWTIITDGFDGFCDVIYCKEQFYTMNWNGMIVSCDVGAHPKITSIIGLVVFKSDPCSYLWVEFGSPIIVFKLSYFFLIFL